MEAVEIEAWCKRKQLAYGHAVVLSDVDPDVTDAVLLSALSQVKVFGKSEIVDRCLDVASKTQLVLIKTSTDLKNQTVPDVVGLPGEAGPWPAHVLTAPAENDEFQSKLMSFLNAEGKTLTDVGGLLQPSPLDVIHAISSLVDKCNATSVDSQSYRKLRMFSGVKPTPNGEEEYDAWAEQTTHLLDEWQCSDNIKKQRIVESLKGPAADIVRFLRVQQPTATSYDYMQVLETAFGTTESASDLLVKFRHTYQNVGEKLSTYLLRLDKLLHSLQQDMIALRLRMTHKLREPPSFSELLKEVREEEDMLQSRNDSKNPVMSQSVTPVSKSAPEQEVDPEVAKLKKEISVMKAEMLSLKAATVASHPDTQISQPEVPAKPPYKRNATPQRSGYQEDKPGIFCYRCGEDGHFKRECEGEENLLKVNKRLIKLTKKSGNYRGVQ
uniref:CCHC-type domain-containing protein n=1 Tax=Maylandia zebra TaxID=106582 RepID=A0A3P9DR78_9CICH